MMTQQSKDNDRLLDAIERVFNNAQYQKVIELSEQAINAGFLIPEIFVLAGNAYYLKKNYEQARKLYTQCIEINSQYPAAYFNRALANRQLGEIILGIADYTTVITLGKNKVEAYVNRGVLRMKLHLFKFAIEDFTEALAIQPTMFEALHNRGLAYCELGQHKEAHDDFQMAINQRSIDSSSQRMHDLPFFKG